MKYNFKLNAKGMKHVEKVVEQALIETAGTIKRDLTQSQTMPFDTGELQNRGTHIDERDISNLTVYIVSDKPYARRLYFHPEYNFQKTKNPKAGALWFDPYIKGEKKKFPQRAFEKNMKGKI